MWVEHLQKQRAHAAGHHPDDIGMDQTDWRIAFEQRLIRNRDRLLSGSAIVECAANLLDKLQAQGFDRVCHESEYRVGLKIGNGNQAQSPSCPRGLGPLTPLMK